jgi:hypothetical protein
MEMVCRNNTKVRLILYMLTNKIIHDGRTMSEKYYNYIFANVVYKKDFE